MIKRLRSWRYTRSTSCKSLQVPLEHLKEHRPRARTYRRGYNLLYLSFATRATGKALQQMQLLRCQNHRKCNGVVFHVRQRTRLGDCNDIAAANGPGQRNSGWRAAVCRADLREHGIPKELRIGMPERRIGHDGHTAPLAPWQDVSLNATIAGAVRELISRATITFFNTKQIFHVVDIEIRQAPGKNFAGRA